MNQKTVLCVDDEPNVVRALKRLLRKESYRLLTAIGGEEALAQLQTEDVHLVISDYRMPGMTGTELLSQVAEQYPETVRVVLSGYADAASIVAAINEGHIYRFLTKPWNDEELKANLRSCLEYQELISSHRRLTDELAQRNAELQRLSERQQSLIEERTRSLQLAQEVIQSVPTPLIGIGTDCTIALCNEAAASLLSVHVGQQIRDSLPADLCQRILDSFGRQEPDDGFEVLVGSQAFAATVSPMNEQTDMRGSVVILEADKCIA